MPSTVVENGIVAGNVYEKYNTRNPVARCLVARFLRDVRELVLSVEAPDIHEVGCGEGQLSLFLARETQRRVRGSDFSQQIIKKAVAAAAGADMPIEFKAAGLNELIPPEDAASLVVCCEVLEHLADPEASLWKLTSLAKPYLLISVPREPIWRLLNLARGAYWKNWGNTPGHLQHWSRGRFVDFLTPAVNVLTVRSPLPWTLVLAMKRVGPS